MVKYEKYDQVEFFIGSKKTWVEGIITDVFSNKNEINYKIEYIYNNKNYNANIKQKHSHLYLKLIQKHSEFLSSNKYDGKYCDTCNEFALFNEGMKESDCGNFYICRFCQ